MKKDFLARIIVKAYDSKFYLSLMNLGLNRMIPFNKPHKFKVKQIALNEIEVFLPNIKRNRNHIKGIHACALATLCEMTTGLLLISRLDPSKFRLIMKKLEIEYFYQAKMDVTAKFKLEETEIERIIQEANSDTCTISPQISVFDKNNSLICTAQVNWHIKSWEKVKTKV